MSVPVNKYLTKNGKPLSKGGKKLVKILEGEITYQYEPAEFAHGPDTYQYEPAVFEATGPDTYQYEPAVFDETP